MKKPDLSKFIKDAQSLLTKHSPEILMGIGITGMLTTTILAVKATPKAIKLIEAKKEIEEVDELTPIETVKTCWKCYIPAAATGVASMACLIGSSSVSVRRNAALATAYKISETAIAEYREKVIETIGEKKEQVVREKVSESRIEKNPVSKNEVIVTAAGNTLCYEYLSGRYFYSDIDKIKKIVNELNAKMLSDGYISLNEFYEELGLDQTGIGDQVGWNLYSCGRELIKLHFSSHLSDDGRPCLALDYETAPKYDYDKLI